MSGHGPTARPGTGFGIGRPATRRRVLERLRPDGGGVPLDLDLLEVVAELDPGMIDWDASFGERSASPGWVLARAGVTSS